MWTYVRDDRPFGGPDPPAAVFFYSPDRRGEHPEGHLAGFAGILQADAYGGFNRLYKPDRKPGPVLEAACWAHARRKFFVLAEIGLNPRRKLAVVAPLAVEAVKRIDAIFDQERLINGAAAADRLALRQATIAPLVADLETWMRGERAKLSRHAEVARAIDYLLKRWPAFTRFLDDGRICISNNAAERALRGLALGRKSWLFCGSDRGGRTRGGDLLADRHREAQRHRPAGLARRRPRPHRRSPGPTSRRPSPVELAPSTYPRRRLTRGLHRRVTLGWSICR